MKTDKIKQNEKIEFEMDCSLLRSVVYHDCICAVG